MTALPGNGVARLAGVRRLAIVCQLVDVAPGKIWFEGGIGPVAVPRQASDLARPGWSAFVTAAMIRTRWHLLEIGFVYP